MAQEIERKFLVAADSWKAGVVRSERLVDGLLATAKGRKVRIRLYADRATLAVKTQRKSRTRFEFEYEIPRCDAKHLLDTECGRSVLAKTRHYVPIGEFIWEIDVYEAPLDGVILAEVELAAAEQEPPLPPWLGREVTDDPAFHKRRLFADRARRKFVSKPLRAKAKVSKPRTARVSKL